MNIEHIVRGRPQLARSGFMMVAKSTKELIVQARAMIASGDHEGADNLLSQAEAMCERASVGELPPESAEDDR